MGAAVKAVAVKTGPRVAGWTCCGTAVSGQGAGEGGDRRAPKDEDAGLRRDSLQAGLIRLTDGSGAAAIGAVAA